MNKQKIFYRKCKRLELRCIELPYKQLGPIDLEFLNMRFCKKSYGFRNYKNRGKESKNKNKFLKRNKYYNFVVLKTYRT